MGSTLGKDTPESLDLYQIRISISELCAIWDMLCNQFKLRSMPLIQRTALSWDKNFQCFWFELLAEGFIDLVLEFSTSSLELRPQEHHSLTEWMLINYQIVKLEKSNFSMTSKYVRLRSLVVTQSISAYSPIISSKQVAGSNPDTEFQWLKHHALD